jgi:hypothetical protein
MELVSVNGWTVAIPALQILSVSLAGRMSPAHKFNPVARQYLDAGRPVAPAERIDGKAQNSRTTSPAG